MNVETFVRTIGAEFYTGVPDSQLKPLCDYLMSAYGIDPRKHIIAANEGNCAALAAGYHLATGKIPVVYLQNSGEGNIINPAASLLSDEIYGIPIIFVIGWRGEPGIHDEPQHAYQGKVTVRLLEDMNIHPFIIGNETTDAELWSAMEAARPLLAKGKSVAFVVRKDALTCDFKPVDWNEYSVVREEAIRHIVTAAQRDIIVSTTGKTSRELYEIRDQIGQSHQHDFLTVGSMGHSSSVALGLAIHKPNARVWCIDGDGAVLMHMGAVAVIGTSKQENLIHIVINNSAHESVGGMPTAAGSIDLPAVAHACGYRSSISVNTLEQLDNELKHIKTAKGPSLIEIKCALGARSNLGRPVISAMENKRIFMNYVSEI